MPIPPLPLSSLMRHPSEIDSGLPSSHDLDMTESSKISRQSPRYNNGSTTTSLSTPPNTALNTLVELLRVKSNLVKGYAYTKKVGNYLVGRTLGTGSFAKVKEGLHCLTGEKVAVKVIDKERVKQDAYVRRNLRREGRILQRLRHKNIVQLYEILETEHAYYLVMELCSGGDNLMHHILNHKCLSEYETKRYLREMIVALDYMHNVGVLHRDLKVENVLITQDGVTKIIDFGLSALLKSGKAMAVEEGLTAELCKTQCGSPAYAAPEVLSKKPYDYRVDIWSLGIDMYAMLVGSLPFTVQPFSIKKLCEKMMLRQMNPLPDGISNGCRDLLHRLLEPNPEQRISLRAAMEHPWINECALPPLEPSPLPSAVLKRDLHAAILHYMSKNLAFRGAEVSQQLVDNIPSSGVATYHLLLNRLKAASDQGVHQGAPFSVWRLLQEADEEVSGPSTDLNVEPAPLQPAPVQSQSSNIPQSSFLVSRVGNSIRNLQAETAERPSFRAPFSYVGLTRQNTSIAPSAKSSLLPLRPKCHSENNLPIVVSTNDPKTAPPPPDPQVQSNHRTVSPPQQPQSRQVLAIEALEHSSPDSEPVLTMETGPSDPATSSSPWKRSTTLRFSHQEPVTTGAAAAAVTSGKNVHVPVRSSFNPVAGVKSRLPRAVLAGGVGVSPATKRFHSTPHLDTGATEGEPSAHGALFYQRPTLLEALRPDVEGNTRTSNIFTGARNNAMTTRHRPPIPQHATFSNTTATTPRQFSSSIRTHGGAVASPRQQTTDLYLQHRTNTTLNTSTNIPQHDVPFSRQSTVMGITNGTSRSLSHDRLPLGRFSTKTSSSNTPLLTKGISTEDHLNSTHYSAAPVNTSSFKTVTVASRHGTGTAAAAADKQTHLFTSRRLLGQSVN